MSVEVRRRMVASLLAALVFLVPAVALGWFPVSGQIEIGPGELPAVKALIAGPSGMEYESIVGYLETELRDADGELVEGEVEIRRLIHRAMVHVPDSDFYYRHTALVVWYPDEPLEVGEYELVVYDGIDGNIYSSSRVTVVVVDEAGASPGELAVTDVYYEDKVDVIDWSCCECWGPPPNCDHCARTHAERYIALVGELGVDTTDMHTSQWVVHVLDNDGESARSTTLQSLLESSDPPVLERAVWSEEDEPCLSFALEGIHDESWHTTEQACVDLAPGFFGSFGEPDPDACVQIWDEETDEFPDDDDVDDADDVVDDEEQQENQQEDQGVDEDDQDPEESPDDSSGQGCSIAPSQAPPVSWGILLLAGMLAALRQRPQSASPRG